MYDLTRATFNRNIGKVRRLLAAGNIPQEYKDNALNAAVETDRTDIVRLLLANGANPTTALAAAAGASYLGSDEMVQLLLEAGADVTPGEDFNLSAGDYALTIAAFRERIGTVKLLLQAGSNRTLPRRFYTSPGRILLGRKYGAKIDPKILNELYQYFDILNTVYYRELSQLILEYV